MNDDTDLLQSAMVFAMERMHDGRYIDFLDFILGETDERCLIGVYLLKAIEHNGINGGLEDLATVMWQAIDTDVLHAHYLEEARVLLFKTYENRPEIIEPMKELFDIYRRAKVVEDDYRAKRGQSATSSIRAAPGMMIYPKVDYAQRARLADERMAALEAIVSDNKYAADWPHI